MNIPLNESENENDKFDFTEIRSFADACEHLGPDHNNLPRLGEIPKRYKRALLAFFKLQVITEAVNHGWVPDLKDKYQLKYIPQFETDSSGTGFAAFKISTGFQHLKASTWLFCESHEKGKHISVQFEDLFKDLLLIDRNSQDPRTESKKPQIKMPFRHGGYR